jgi:hypothetical protein
MRTTESATRTPGKPETYHCFLVRCRREGNGQPAWRFTVQQAGGSGARHSFTCFDDVAAHMRAELASGGAASSGRTRRGRRGTFLERNSGMSPKEPSHENCRGSPCDLVQMITGSSTGCSPA